MFLLLSLLSLLAAPSSTASDTSARFKALRFTQEPYSNIQFVPDFSRFTHAISACVWIKSLGSAGYPTIFFYGSNDLTMMDDGNYICIHGTCNDWRSSFTVPKRTWYHTCVTWAVSSRSHKYYVNGELLGSRETSSGRLLSTGRTLILGNYGGNWANHEFGGEMVYLNFYAKELSASEVKEMADNGLCFNMAAVDKHEAVRLLKWEEIMKKSRGGTITEVDMAGTCASTIKLLSQLQAMKTKLDETTEDLEETRQELERKKETELSLDQELKNVSSQLNATLADLEGVSKELNNTQEELEKLSTRLNETEEELGRAKMELEKYNRTKNKWDWSMFLTEQYVNTTISSEQSQQIRTSWDDVAMKLVGYTITDELIQFWKIVDCLELDNRPWSMLYSDTYLNKELTEELAQGLISLWDGISDKLVGVTMTQEVIELLEYVSKETNCYCGNAN